METVNNAIRKPIQLRIIFIMNALMMILPFIFYFVFTTNNITIGDLDPMHMVYTGIGYILSFVLLVTTILRKKLILFRSIFLLNVLIALPTGAYIGIAVAIISMAISFNQKIKAFFDRAQ